MIPKWHNTRKKKKPTLPCPSWTEQEACLGGDFTVVVKALTAAQLLETSYRQVTVFISKSVCQSGECNESGEGISDTNHRVRRSFWRKSKPQELRQECGWNQIHTCVHMAPGFDHTFQIQWESEMIGEKSQFSVGSRLILRFVRSSVVPEGERL